MRYNQIHTYCLSFLYVLCDRLNIFSHWLPLLSHAWHVIPVSGNFISIVILDCVAKMETYARAAKHVAGYIIQIHPTPLLCICFPLLGCIDPQIRTSVKDISPLGSAPVTMAFAAKISCDGSCKHKLHHLVESLCIISWKIFANKNIHHRFKILLASDPRKKVDKISRTEN